MLPYTITIERPDGTTLVWQVTDVDLYNAAVHAIEGLTGAEADVVYP